MIRAVAIVTLALLAGSASAQPPQPSPEAVAQLDRARAAMNRNQYEEAIGEFRRVLKTNSNCVECYFQLVRAYQKLGARKDALEAARKALELAPDDRLRAVAHNAIGVEISALATSGKGRHEDAETEFRTALQLDPNNVVSYYNIGTELMKEFHDAEGIVALREYLKRTPEGPDAAKVRALIDNPRRARENFAPAEFSLVTKAGEFVTLDEVKGRVVLLDFWASWCKPCEAALPTLQRLSKKYPRDQFVLVSVSVDTNEQAWEGFIASHNMNWPQALDRDSKVRRMFNVQPIPTYVLIDAEGIMRSYVTGSGTDAASQLEDAVKKSLKNAQHFGTALAAASPAPSPARAAVPIGNPIGTPAARAMVPGPAPVAEVAPPTPAADAAPKPVSPASSGMQSVQVTSNPDGAEIYVDQNFFGNAPATLKLQPGRHNLRLSMPGYRSWMREVTAQPDSEARLTASMVKSVPGSIQGRVLWNEQPMAGVQVTAGECGPAPRPEPVTTDAEGHYAIANVPDGRVCVNVRAPNPSAFTTNTGTFIDLAPGKETIAPDAYLCKVFEATSPKAGEFVTNGHLTLKWDPFPGAANYAVQVWHTAPTFTNVFRRGWPDKERERVETTYVPVDTDIPPGEYYWRVDAYNRAGHVMGCIFPVKFTVTGASR